MYLCAPTQCDCMPDFQGYSDWVALPATDYAALEAECERLKNSLLAITARHFAESWKKRTSDAELEQYLSVGIAQLEAERDALAAELAAYKAISPYRTRRLKAVTKERDDLAAELAAIKGLLTP